MHLATHIIRLKGTFDNNIWTDDSLKHYIKEKVKHKIFDTFHANVENIGIIKNNIDVSVLISCLPSEVSNPIISKWIKTHITEKGVRVTWFNIEEINCLYEPRKYSILLE